MNFNKQQQEVIDTLDGNLAVIATAGSGKTTVLTNRIVNMISHGISSNKILAVTFSKKAKKSIEKKLEQLNVYGVNVETFHSLALKIIHSAYGSRYSIWTTQWQKIKVVSEICDDIGMCDKDNTPYNDIASFISQQKVFMVKSSDQLIYSNAMPFKDNIMKLIYEKYEGYKETHNLIEFDDFLNMANDILDTYPEINTNYSSMFQYVLSDEFQDISLSQFLLLQKLNSKNTMIVGDPLQAIYAFRGGHSKYILQFDEIYKNAKVINLNTNYRCSQDIVNTANELAATIPDSNDKHYIESIAANKSYKKPEYIVFDTEYDEATWISSKILSLSKKYDCSEIAILARTNAQLQKLQTSLHDDGIKYDVVGGNVFTELPEIKLIIGYLKLALYNNDNDSFRYVYNKPNRWLDKKFLEEVEQKSLQNNISLYHAMFEIDRRNWRFKNGIDELFEVINCLKNRKWQSVGKMIEYLCDKLNIVEFVSKGKTADDGKAMEQKENIDSFINIANKHTDLKEFIYYLSDIEKDLKNTDSGKKIQLSTIHRAKGLEYDVVFIIGCNNGLLPHSKNDNEDDERRLFYVAITRAKKELYLSSTSFYNSQYTEPSKFLNAIKNTISVKEMPISTEN